MKSPEKIKVLMVAPQEPLVGGQAIQAGRLLNKFQHEDEIEVDLQPINPRFLAPFQKVRFLRTFVTTFKYIFDLLVKIPRYDVIHIFSASYFSFLLAPTPAILIAKLFGKKTILNYRSGEAKDHLSRWKTSVSTIKLADKVIVPSGYLVDVFKEFGLEAGSIFNFVETDKFPARDRKKLSPVFLSNRNFEKLYNVGCTLEAFKKIQIKFPEAKLIIVGDGSERAKLEDIARSLKLNNYEFCGQLSSEEMLKKYNEADIYLNSPNTDNMPNSIIEAFAAGLPVVSTNAGGIPYIVEHNKTGLLVDVGDCESLAMEAIQLLEDERLAARIISNAGKESNKYSWGSVREKWLSSYRALAERGVS